MANKKNKSRQRSQSAESKNSDPAKQKAVEKEFPKLEPNPPKPNLVLVVASGVLMVAWMIFLAVIAIS